MFVDFCEVTNESIILGQGGNFNIHFASNFTASKHVCVIQTNEPNLPMLLYIYHLIPLIKNTFIVNGSTIGWLNKTNIRDLKIPIPKNKQIINDLEPMFAQIETLHAEIQSADVLYKQRIQQLSDESMGKK
jgi:restriction endonuclease S subunit